MRPGCVSLLLLALVLLSAARAQSPLELLKLPVPPADFRLSYSSNALNFGELRLPKNNGPHAVIILLHGGCWKSELKGRDPRATSLDLLNPIAADLAASGFACWNVEYRRVGNEGGGWPGTFHDVADSIDFLRTIAPKHFLDLSRIAIIGHSAGGQLALWAGARPKIPRSNPLFRKNPLQVKAVFNVDGPIDLKAAAPFSESFCGFPAIPDFMGGPPDKFPERYASCSILPLLPLAIRQEIVVGSLLDGTSAQFLEYRELVAAKGEEVGILNLKEAGHFGFLFPNTDHWKILKQRVEAVIDSK
jgi:acetyl esterase/lipase